VKSLNLALGRFAAFGPFVLRVVLGVLFVLHGIDKFRTGLGNVSDFFAAEGVPLSSITAPATAIAEVVLGAALIAGLFTRVAAAALAVVMAGAIIWVKGSGGILGSSELDLAYLAGLVGLVLLGPGALSADEVLDQDETVIDLRSRNAVNVA